MGRVFGIVALIFGILSIPLAIFAAWVEAFGGVFGMISIANLINILGWILTGVAILFGIIGLIIDKPKKVAIAGLSLGVGSIILRFSFILFFMWIFAEWSSLFP